MMLKLLLLLVAANLRLSSSGRELSSFVDLFINKDWKASRNEDPAIIDGESISIEKVPYQAVLFREVTPSRRPFCGAAIISRRVLLTAAHCVETEEAKYAGVGHESIHQVEVFTVSKSGHHPSYKTEKECPQQLHVCVRYPIYDIGYVMLEEKLPLSDRVKPIALSGRTPNNGSPAYVSGWGGTKLSERQPMTDELRGVSIKVYKSYKCRNLKYLRDIEPDDNICYQVRGDRGTAYGDSGGPIVVKRKLAGIVSFGWIDDKNINTDAYANVAHFREWICQNTRVGCSR